jgi:hypothetical protein
MSLGPFDANVYIGIGAAIVVSLAAHGALLATARRWSWTTGLSSVATLFAIAIGLIVMHPPTGLPPTNVLDWPPWVALAGAIMLAVAPTRRLRRALVAALLSAAGALLIFHRLQEFAPRAIPYALVAGVAAGLVSWLTDLALEPRGPLAARATVLAMALAAFGALMYAGSFDIAGRGAVIPAAIGAPIALAWWRSPADGLPAAGAISFTIVAALAYGETDWTTPPRSLALAPAFALVALAPLAAWLGRIPGVNQRPRLAATVAVAASLLVAGAGVAWLALHQPVKSADDGYGW